MKVLLVNVSMRFYQILPYSDFIGIQAFINMAAKNDNYFDIHPLMWYQTEETIKETYHDYTIIHNN